MTALSGRVLITGASGGIGRAIARAFAVENADLVLAGRRGAILEPLAAQLGARSVVADLAHRGDLQHLVDEAGEVDILVANAALPATGPIGELSQAEIDVLIEVNLTAPIALARALLPAMVARGRGHLVFISSLSGKVASPYASLYNATKFGLRGFALGVREDLHGSGVSASVILPGFISDAGMFHDSGVRLPPGIGTRTPQQVAAGVLRAVSRDRAEVTVAPLGLRLGAEFAGFAPQVSARIQRLSGGARIARGLHAGQAAKRPRAQASDVQG
jgi:short-subunit dehydrogenase